MFGTRQPCLRHFSEIAILPSAEALGYWQLPLRGMSTYFRSPDLCGGTPFAPSGLDHWPAFPAAYAVGFILLPLRGCAI